MSTIAEVNPLLKGLGFNPENGSKSTWIKSYAFHDNYKIKVNTEEQRVDYGNKITVGNKAICNLGTLESFVVLECVNRLLEKNYKPKNIILEKAWPTGHNTSGKLDILVTRDNGVTYLMIECKTYGPEFDKEVKRIFKDGGQLFTYFQQDKNAVILMLYTSRVVENSNIQYRNEIIKIEEDYRQTGNVKDFHDRWNKLTKNNGVFDPWVKAYDFHSKALTSENLKEIKQEDSSFIFNQFLEILRHNVVSDKPNAFNKIFTLFLCKIYDERCTEKGKELGFQWLEGVDTHITFQKRLTDLYKKGMKEFLEKEVSDISDQEFEDKFGYYISDKDAKDKILHQFTELRLKKNNEFAIKEVFDDASFEDNAKVVKEVVELLQGYKIRYAKKQQYLSDFFELLLTTGLKQESGQFFTPVPIAQFIIKSMPIDKIVKDKLNKGEKDNLLPTIIDYAAGSGHFITESMHEIQRIINAANPKNYIADTAKKINVWKEDHFDWALKYVYGVEKDYRLVKVGKVGCYLHGDGLAQIIHSDGLGNFRNTGEYKELLRKTDKDDVRENRQFDIVVSNPPYSVSAFKNNARKYYTENDFELYQYLTDQSSEIECLFIERTKQLLKDGGIAGIILPSSILSNAGIYTKAREIILQYFEIIAIAGLGSNTFMATGTNTVTLFMRRRNNYDCKKINSAVKDAILHRKDVIINQIEKPVSKYVSHVWEGITHSDYISLLQKQPNKVIENHEIYKEYRKKIKDKNEKEFWDNVIKLEQEKIFYFILTYSQKVTLVNSGDKNAEKQFLGYEFSNRRGNEGIHPIQRGKSIEECTRLFDPEVFDNPEKASTYIYQAFQGDLESEIHQSLRNNITRVDLVDMLTFDRADFEKSISLAVKKKVKYENIWKSDRLESLENIAVIKKGTSITQSKTSKGDIPVIAGGQELAYFHNESNRNGNVVTVSASGAYAGFVNYFSKPIFASDCNTVHSRDESIISTKLLFIFLKTLQPYLYELQRGQAQPHVYEEDLAKVKIPLPPKAIQEEIVEAMEILDAKEKKAKEDISNYRNQIFSILESIANIGKISDLCKVSVVKVNPQKFMEEAFINIGLENIESDTGKVLDKPLIRGADILSVKNVFSKGDILYGKLRPYLNKVVIADFDGICSTDILVLKAEVPLILKYILLSIKVVRQTSSAMNGVSLPRIKAETFLNIEIPLPSKEEQQKIITQIEAIEKQMLILQKEIAAIPEQKEIVLRKYL